MNKLNVKGVAILALLAAPVASFAQASVWTSPCSAGATIDEASTGLYAVGGASLGLAPGMAGSVTARYNVAYPLFPGTPTWDTMQLGYLDPAGGGVAATLYRVHICDGALKPICSITSTDFPVSTCQTCTISEQLNFIANLYYVLVTVSQPSAATIVQAKTLRIYDTP